MSQVISVTQLNRYVAALLDRDPHLGSIQVQGELSGFKKYGSGHLYFTLKDETAAVSCVMFKGQTAALAFKPQDGMKVVVMAKASLYDRDGRFQLYVQSMQADGLGQLYQAYELLKQKLAAEGLFDDRYKQKIPYLPKTIGVITSSSGAVIRDIIHVLKRRFPGFHLQLMPVAVQGDGAAAQIAAAIEQFNRIGRADLLIVGRGGGSIEDLWAFNEEVVARAVFKSVIPIISAVGHETDFTICDFVADLRAPTPSAAAELAVPVRADLEQQLLQTRFRMQRALNKQLDYQKMRLARLIDRPILSDPAEMIHRRRNRLEKLQNRLSQAILKDYGLAERRFDLLCGQLDALSPLKVLQRGYAAVQDSRYRMIQSVHAVKIQDQVNIQMQDGLLICQVNQILDSIQDGRSS